MSYDLEQQEQLADVKAWWAAHGKWIVGAVLVALIAFAGWQGIDRWRTRQAIAADNVYDSLQKAAAEKNSAAVISAADALVNQYPRTIYAPMAAMLAARFHFDGGDLPAARKRLTWAIANAKQSELIALARYRLAAVLIDEKNFDEALSTLTGSVPDAFAGLYADRRGDIQALRDNKAEARKEYQTALDKTDSELASLRNLIQIKLDALGEG